MNTKRLTSQPSIHGNANRHRQPSAPFTNPNRAVTVRERAQPESLPTPMPANHPFTLAVNRTIHSLASPEMIRKAGENHSKRQHTALLLLPIAHRFTE